LTGWSFAGAGLRSSGHRAQLRPGLRPVQIWVTDLVAEAFAADADRQSRLVAADEHAEADPAFVDAVSEWPGE